MAETLPDVGSHSGVGYYSGPGHYEATVDDEGDVVIKTILDGAGPTYAVSLPSAKWDRLVAWVEWQRKNKKAQVS